MHKPLFKDITAEDVLSSLPNFPKSRAAEGQEKIQALIKAFNYLVTMKNLEVRDYCYPQDNICQYLAFW